MARTKQRTPMRREASVGWIDLREAARNDETRSVQNGAPLVNQKPMSDTTIAEALAPAKAAGVTELVICVAGIYASFLSWALLQERITTTSYGPPAAPEVFTYSVFLNTVQSFFAFLIGYIYLSYSSRSTSKTPSIFPSRAILSPLLLVSVTSSLASPFGYASLKHVGYITFILAKSCKLLPVMALHVSVFRKSYPFYKYAVVALVTAGVAIFTLQHPSSSKKSATPTSGNVSWGIFLLSINLLFDGLTNSTQDYINGAFAPFSGSQMMCAQNLISTLLTSAYLISAPFLASSSLLTSIIPLPPNAGDELSSALTFVTKYPAVGYDVLAFAACGAVGQVFIFYTLAKFSSLLLVTITVTRKMLTMLLSVVWFGHRLSAGQWLGVGLVFGGVGAEAAIGRWEKKRKGEEARRKKA
ncbi:MAG: UDP-galactose transporter [Chrysothrix sp. TS-e1954]|nr:MAG: UDP-galactose transporter [Chrysothrix sp. TS-e1954]